MTKTHYELEIRTSHEGSFGLWHIFDKGPIEYLRKHYDVYMKSQDYEARMFKVDVTRVKTEIDMNSEAQ